LFRSKLPLGDAVGSNKLLLGDKKVKSKLPLGDGKLPLGDGSFLQNTKRVLK
jgi:hypothetical protein